MKLIPNSKAVAAKSHSMWAQYLGLLALVAPDALFVALGHDVASPRLWFFAGLALLIYGMAGRLVEQGLSK